jgi:ketosteroid isomerase-like protein
MNEARAEENVALVKHSFEALAEGGVEAILPLIDEQFEVTTPAHLASEPDTYRGHEGVRRWFDTFYEAMDDVRLVPGEVRPVGEQVAVDTQIVARGRTTGLELTQDAAMLWTLRDGKAVRVDVFATVEEAIAAASAS